MAGYMTGTFENALETPLTDKPNLSKCPMCGGLADNGHDRELPPNVYACSKCHKKMSDGAQAFSK